MTSTYRRPPLAKNRRPSGAPDSPEQYARREVRRLDGAWTDMDWSLCQRESIRSGRGHLRGMPSRLEGVPPLRLEPPSPLGALWTLAALLCESQEPSSAPDQWATLGSEKYRPRAKRHPEEILPPPFEHSAYLYLFTTRFPPAAQRLGIHTLMSDRDVWATYTRRYRSGRVLHNPVVRAMLQSAETFVPPAQWPDYLLRVILSQPGVPFFPSPQRTADVLLMGAPLAPSFVPRQRGAHGSISDVTEPFAFLLLVLIGLTPEQMVEAGIPLPATRIKELAALGLQRALEQSRVFKTWFSGVDTRHLPGAERIPTTVHDSLEVDAYPLGWSNAVAQILKFHVDAALMRGTAIPRSIPTDDCRAPAGHTWGSIHEALNDTRNPVALIYANYYIAKKATPAIKGVEADLTHYPPDPANTYGIVRPRDIKRRPLYALSRPETKQILHDIAENLHKQPHRRPRIYE